MATTINTNITITIIKVSERGAYLITDGVKQAWTRPSSRRADGTWTASAYEALRTSTDTPEAYAKRKEAYIKERQEERERRQKMIVLVINEICEITDTDKCFKVNTGRKVPSPYKRGQFVSEYIYLPKSQVKPTTYNGVRAFEIPTWLYETNECSYSRIGTINE
jgi:hypothetical protein